MQLSGIPSEFVNLTFSNTYQGRSVKLWLGCLNSSAQIIADPLLVFRGEMDTISIQDTGETATISLAVESEMIELQEASNRRYTDQDQQTHFPGDLGLQYIAALQDKEVTWGVATSSAQSTPPGSATTTSSVTGVIGGLGGIGRGIR
jgi:hypothetical protein